MKTPQNRKSFEFTWIQCKSNIKVFTNVLKKRHYYFEWIVAIITFRMRFALLDNMIKSEILQTSQKSSNYLLDFCMTTWKHAKIKKKTQQM